MIGCDGSDNCPGNNWFHPECVGLGGKKKPRGAWYCEECKHHEGLLKEIVPTYHETQNTKKTKKRKSNA